MRVAQARDDILAILNNQGTDAHLVKTSPQDFGGGVHVGFDGQLRAVRFLNQWPYP